MANIHGMNDVRNNRGNRGGPGPNRDQGNNGNNGTAALYELLGMDNREQKDPRQETFFEMLHLNFCPTLKLMSHTSLVTLVNVGLYVVSLVVSGVQTDKDFLQVQNEPLISKVSMNPLKIRNDYQYYRLLTPCFFHLSFLHIVMNSFGLIIWGSFIETFCGTLKYATIYLFAGICGNLMSASINNEFASSIGASGCIMGVTATLVGMLILNWMAFGEGELKEFRGMLTCIVIMITIFTLLFTAVPGGNSNAKTDNWAHLGGFLGGFFLSMAIGRVFGRQVEKPYEKRVRFIGYLLSAALVLATLLPLVFSK